MHHPIRATIVLEAGSKTIHQADGLIRRAKQQGAGIGTDRTATEIRDHTAPFKACKDHRI
ncbi:MAG: hypothetical protein Kilf2KO_24360 [Rhodospirillales bacterium]